MILGSGRLFALLPVRVALALGRAFGTIAHALLAAPRRFAREHVALAFPEWSPAEQRRLVRETFRHAGTSFAELLVFRKLTRRPSYVDVDAAALDAALAGGRGAIVVTGHTGNWELLAAWAAFLGYPLTVVVRVNDPNLHGLILRFRREAGVEVLVRDDPGFVRAVREALGRNRVVAILIDQDTRGAAGVFVPFFGRLARTPPGAALLALRTGAPVVTAFINRRQGGGHVIRVAPVEVDAGGTRGDAGALTARLTAAIEAQIRRAPAEWVWWHERWRSQPSSPRPGVRPGRRARPRHARVSTP